MSWWNAKYKNDHDEYEITFGSRYREKTKIVEKVCKAIIDKKVQSEDDIAIVRHGRWKISCDGYYPYCSVCREEPKGGTMTPYCPNCGARMDGDAHG